MIPTVPPGSSADSWLNLRKQIDAMLDLLAGNRWRYSPNLDVSRRQAEAEWLAFHWRHSEEVDVLCETLAESNKIGTEDMELRYQMQCRFWMAGELVVKTTYAHKGHWMSPFPFPEDGQLLRRLVIDWWRGVGQFWAFDQVYESKLLLGIAPE